MTPIASSNHIVTPSYYTADRLGLHVIDAERPQEDLSPE
jgi:hypothetical protein